MQTYIFHLSRADQPDPEVLSVTVSGDPRAREVALEILGRSPDHRAVRAWTGGIPVFELTAGEIED